MLVPKPTVEDLDEAVRRLGLERDGDMRSSVTSLLCPVTRDGRPAFLKLTNEPDELLGARALELWDGQGAVRVIARDGNAVLLERAGRTLRSASPDDDVFITETLCRVAGRLHARAGSGVAGFPSLRTWFSSLLQDTSPRFDQVRRIADRLLDRTGPVVLLHGDLHQENILHGGERGWLAIDPKGIIGAREFDYCSLFTNWTQQEAAGFFDQRLRLVEHAAAIQSGDLLQWISAWSALSGIWHLEGGDEELARLPLSVMALALDRLQ